MFEPFQNLDTKSMETKARLAGLQAFSVPTPSVEELASWFRGLAFHIRGYLPNDESEE